MYILDTTNKIFVINTQESIVSNGLAINGSFMDCTQGSYTTIGVSGVANNGIGSTPVTVIASPGAGNVRQIKNLTIYNADTIAHNVIVAISGTSPILSYPIVNCLLNPAQNISYEDHTGWDYTNTSSISASGLTGYVPYSGASQSVNLNGYNISNTAVITTGNLIASSYIAPLASGTAYIGFTNNSQSMPFASGNINHLFVDQISSTPTAGLATITNGTSSITVAADVSANSIIQVTKTGANTDVNAIVATNNFPTKNITISILGGTASTNMGVYWLVIG